MAMRIKDYMNTVVTGRCMRCRTNRAFTVTTADRSTNGGTVILKGACSECGTTVCRMVGKIED